MALQFTIIDTAAAFAPLAGEWNDLARRSATDHAFMRHEWFAAWLKHLPYAGEPRILLARREGRLVGAAPLRIYEGKRRGARFRILAFLQSGISPRCHFLMDRDEDPAAVFDGLWTITGWDMAELKGLELEHDLTRRLIDRVRDKGPFIVEPFGSSPYQIMPATWDEFVASRGKNMRKKFRKMANRSDKTNGTEVLRITRYAELADVFPELLEISGKSWKRNGGTDLQTQTAMGEFLREFAETTDGQDLWVVYLLRIDGRPAAFDYYLHHDGRLCGLRWEYVEEFAYFMPGVILHVAAMQDLIEAWPGGEYDTAGMDSEFKVRLVDSVRQHVDLTFGTASAKSRLLLSLKQGLLRARGIAAAIPLTSSGS